jgi:hypothetical protein
MKVEKKVFLGKHFVLPKNVNFIQGDGGLIRQKKEENHKL